MTAWRWIWAGAGLLLLPGCGGGRLVPPDISSLLQSDSGRLVLKTAEGHGGVWRWRQRPYAQFDHSLIVTGQKVDTVIENRGKDTTMTPRLDTSTLIRETCVLDLHAGKRFARSVSTTPTLVAGFDGSTSWSAQNNVPDSAYVRDMRATQLSEATFCFSLPFTLVDTTLKFSSLGDLPMVDTNITKGREPGTFDTTIANFNCARLKVEWTHGQAPVDWMVFYIDQRDGRIRRTLSPAMSTDGFSGHVLTVWSDLLDAVGLKVGGRRLGYPATAEGQVTGPFRSDRRIYNVEFPRQLDNEPFNWSPTHSAAVFQQTETRS